MVRLRHVVLDRDAASADGLLAPTAPVLPFAVRPSRAGPEVPKEVPLVTIRLRRTSNAVRPCDAPKTMEAAGGLDVPTRLTVPAPAAVKVSSPADMLTSTTVPSPGFRLASTI